MSTNVEYLQWMSKKIDLISERLDELNQHAHTLSTQQRGDVLKGIEGVTSSNLFTSTPVHLKVHPTAKWSSLDSASQLQLLQDVATKHTKVSLDFEGLRHSILASQRASVLESVFGLNDSSKSYDPEEQAYVRGYFEQVEKCHVCCQPTNLIGLLDNIIGAILLELLEENLELSKKLLCTMDKYIEEHVKSMKLKMQGTKEFEKIRFLFPKLLKEYESSIEKENDCPATLKVRQETLEKEEKKLTQMKTLLQKLMISYPNLGLDSCDEKSKKSLREIFVMCGEPISSLRDK